MLEVKNLTKIYRVKGGVETRALDGVTLSFPKTGMVFLLGKSGSGKSTLLNLCGGLDSPTEGEILVKGRSSKSFSKSDFDSYRNTFIGFIFQEYNILDEFTVGENISLALELQGKPKEEARIAEILREVEMEEFASRKPNTLSGGQKQRVAIARALVKNPEIIMADEPTGALDSVTGEQVFDTLKRLSSDKLVLVVSHDREFAERYADRIIELKDGKVLSDHSKTEEGFVDTLPQEREEEETPTFIRSRLPVKRAVRMGASGLKTKPVRLAFTVLLCLLSFALFGLFSTLMLYDMEVTVRKSLQNSDRAHIVLQKEFEVTLHDYRPEYGGWQEYVEGWDSRFTQEELESCKAVYGDGVFGVVAASCAPSNLGGDVRAYPKMEWAGISNFAYIPENHPLREKIICGHYPTADEEVLISEYVAYGIMARGFGDEQENPKTIEEIVGKKLDIFEDCTVAGVFKSDLDGLMEKFPALVRGATPTREEYEKQNRTFEQELDETLNGVAFLNEAQWNSLAQSEQIRVDMFSQMTTILRSNNTWIYFGKQTEERISPSSYYAIKMLPKQASVCGSRTPAQGEMVVTPSLLSKLPKLLNMWEELGERMLTIEDKTMPFYEWANALEENAFIEWEDGRQEIPYPPALRVKIAEGLLNEVKDIAIGGRLATWNGFDGGYYSLIGTPRTYRIVGIVLNPTFRMDRVFMEDALYEQMRHESITFRAHGQGFIEKWGETDYVESENMKYDFLFLPYDHSNKQTEGLKAFTFDFEESCRSVPCNYLVYEVFNVSETIEDLSKIFLWVGVGMAIFSALLLSNFISVSIANKKKDIGILRALGARGTDVFKIFFAESFFIAAACVGLGIVASVIGCGVLNAQLGAALSGVSLFVFGPVSIGIMLAVSLLTAVLATFLPVYLAARKKPVDSIRSL